MGTNVKRSKPRKVEPPKRFGVDTSLMANRFCNKDWTRQRMQEAVRRRVKRSFLTARNLKGRSDRKRVDIYATGSPKSLGMTTVGERLLLPTYTGDYAVDVGAARIRESRHNRRKPTNGAALFAVFTTRDQSPSKSVILFFVSAQDAHRHAILSWACNILLKKQTGVLASISRPYTSYNHNLASLEQQREKRGGDLEAAPHIRNSCDKRVR